MLPCFILESLLSLGDRGRPNPRSFEVSTGMQDFLLVGVLVVVETALVVAIRAQGHDRNEGKKPNKKTR